MRVLKPLIFLAGRVAVGKTTFAGAQFKGAALVSVRDVILQKLTLDQVAEQPNPCAPADEFVRQAVKDAARHVGGVVVFDGFPATASQFWFLNQLATGVYSEAEGYAVQLWYMRCDAVERHRRLDAAVTAASLADNGPMVRWLCARDDREDKDYPDLVDMMLCGRVPVTLLDTGTPAEQARPVRVIDRGLDLAETFETVAKADARIWPALAQVPAEMRGPELERYDGRAVWLRRFAGGALGELQELLGMLSDSVRGSNPVVPELEVDELRQRTGAALRYLFSAARMAGLGPHDIGRIGVRAVEAAVRAERHRNELGGSSPTGT